MTEKTIAELVRELEIATKDYEEQRERAATAQHGATDALNRLNACQRSFDARVHTIKKGAPYSSDWVQRERVAIEVPG